VGGVVVRAAALLLALVALPGCALAFMAGDAGGAGESCPGEQRTTCHDALELGGSVCGTGPVAEKYQALVECACSGDEARCSSECGMGLCAGGAVDLPHDGSTDDDCTWCMATKCGGEFSQCSGR
jgi:hypothetical protein